MIDRWMYLGIGAGGYIAVTMILLYVTGRWALDAENSKDDKTLAMKLCFSWPVLLALLPFALIVLGLAEAWKFCARALFAWFDGLSVQRSSFTHEDRPSGPYRTSVDRDD